MNTAHLIPTAASLALALCASVGAQKSFDLILPTSMDHPVFVNGTMYQEHIGLVVNTGTEPITRDEFRYAMFHSRSSAALDRFEWVPSWGNWQVLQPAEAAGSDDPIYRQLLVPDERYVDGGFGAHYVRSNAPVGTQARITTHLEIGGQRVRSTIDVTWVDDTTEHRIHGVQRISSIPVTLGIEELAAGCPLPGESSPWRMRTRSNNALEGGTTGLDSELPVLGNERLMLEPGRLPESQIGRPYVVIWGLGDRTLNLLGCETIVFIDALGAGTVEAAYMGGAWCGRTPTPIPNDPLLAGAQIGVQAVVLTPDAANGIGTLSQALTLNLFAETDG